MDTCDNDESQCPALVWATWHGHSQIVTWLLEHGANVNVTNAFGNTPLHYAAHWADSHEHGASGCQGNCCNCTDKKLPPHCGNVQDCGGGSSQHMECLKVLIQHGADINAERNDRKTPAEVCADCGLLLLLLLLLC